MSFVFVKLPMDKDGKDVIHIRPESVQAVVEYSSNSGLTCQILLEGNCQFVSLPANAVMALIEQALRQERNDR